MPRNSSGTYTLPAGNPVEAGDVITEAWANTTMADLGNEITNSLDRNGNGGMLAPFRLADGTLPAPGIAWLNEPSTGFYRASAGTMWGAVLGQQILQYTVNGVTVPSGKTLTLNGSLAGTYTVPVANGGTGATDAATARTNLGAGDTNGPASATNNAVALFDGTTGKSVKNSTLTFDGSTLQTSSSTAFYPQFVQVNKTADANAGYVVLDKDRAGAIVQNGDILGNVIFRGYDGAAYHQAAAIRATVGGAPGTNDMPGTLQFLTTADGASSPTERLRINTSGARSAGVGLITSAAITGDDAVNMNIGNLNVVSNTGVGYPAFGYNIASGNAIDTWRFQGADNVSWIQFNANAIRFYQSTNSPSAGGLITSRIAAQIDASGNVLVTGSGGLGYGAGSGGFVDQTGARTSGVALNKPSGQITLSSAAGSTTWTSFTLTNSSIGAFDGVVVTQRSGTDLYEIHVTAKAAGSCRISFRTTGGTTVEQPVFDFQVIKGSAS